MKYSYSLGLNKVGMCIMRSLLSAQALLLFNGMLALQSRGVKNVPENTIVTNTNHSRRAMPNSLRLEKPLVPQKHAAIKTI
jgi:hypothetical protein